MEFEFKDTFFHLGSRDSLQGQSKNGLSFPLSVLLKKIIAVFIHPFSHSRIVCSVTLCARPVLDTVDSWPFPAFARALGKSGERSQDG